MKKIVLILIIIALATAWYFDLSHYLSFDSVRNSLTSIQAFAAESPILLAMGIFGFYVAITALSIPGAVPLTLVTGAIFGLFWGTLIVSFASTIGATLAFLGARYLFKDSVEKRFNDKARTINETISKEGALSLFSLRLVPIFPFFMINLLMGLTNLKARTFLWVSQLGMLPGTLVFVNAGRSLGELESPAGILSLELIIAFTLLAILPWISKGIMKGIHRRRVLSGFSKPTSFDRNLIVIGAGAGGLVSAYIAAAVKAKVTLVEAGAMGGDCLNYGCVPSKAIIRCAKAVKEIKKSEALGIEAQCRVDFPSVMNRVNHAIAKVAPHDSVERYTRLGVDVVNSYATIVDPWTISFKQDGQNKTLSAQHIILATGASPRTFDIPGLDPERSLTTDTLWRYLSECKVAPTSLAILGAGPIGCELAQALNRLGISITLIVRGDRILPKESHQAAHSVQDQLVSEGVNVMLNAVVMGASDTGNEFTSIDVESNGVTHSVLIDKLLFAIGRQPNVKGFGLENIGLTEDQLELNDHLATRFPHIFAVGDLAGPHQFTHAAAHQAWHASVNALFGRFKSFKVDYGLIPRITFTSPEIAAVGLSLQNTIDQQIDYETTRFDLAELDRAIVEGHDSGYIEVITRKGSDKILGVEIVADNAGELLTPFSIAMRHKLGLNKLMSVVHPYPSFGEASKYLAGEWKRAHAPARILAFLAWWFRRGL